MSDYDCAVRVWPELREAIRMQADSDWRLYTWEHREWPDLGAPMAKRMTFNLVCYGSRDEPLRRVEWFINYSKDNGYFERTFQGKTVEQALAESLLDWRLTIQPAQIIGDTTPAVAADWRLFALVVLDAWQDTADDDTEIFVRFTPELRQALRRRRSVFAELARAGANADPDESPRAYNLGITYGWLKELADIAYALETPR